MTVCWFCAQCGSRVYHEGRSRPGFVTVKGGSLDEPQGVPIVAHIWTRSRRTDLILDPALPQWDTQPEGEVEWQSLIGMTE